MGSSQRVSRRPPRQRAQLLPGHVATVGLTSRRYEDLTDPEIATELSSSSILLLPFSSASSGWLPNDFNPDGYVGDPPGGTAERGRQPFERSVATLSEAKEEVKPFDFGR